MGWGNKYCGKLRKTNLTLVEVGWGDYKFQAQRTVTTPKQK